jgi:uncharacterized membrane protein (UPF0127 family)
MRMFLMGLVAYVVLGLGLAMAQDAPMMAMEPVTVDTANGPVLFTAEIADTDETRERGLMFRMRLPDDRAMLFDFGTPRQVAMWMKNTRMPLDMVFIRADGTVAGIARNTKPMSTDVLGVGEPVLAVLEVAGGTSDRIGLKTGDTVYHRIFNNGE